MTVDVIKIDGSKSNENIELNENIFNITPNDHAIYLDIKAYLANQRQGTHKSKERNEVSGGGKKPWRQKGRGGARAGSSRSPLWVGGGTIFGPKPRNYRQRINKKLKQLARKSALSYKFKNNQLLVIDDFQLEAFKTKELINIFSALKINNKKALMLTDGYNEILYKSGRNISNIKILEAQKASTYDLLNNQVVILQKSAVTYIEQNLSNKDKVA